jgi:hypothetical protein
MWQIKSIYLDSIGTPASRFANVRLDLSSADGTHPLDTVLWLRNGGGKSTLVALLVSLMRPRRAEFLSGRQGHEEARALEDYVLSGDTSHVAIEWAHPDGRRLVTGAIYEWPERQAPADPAAGRAKLKIVRYSFNCDGNKAELDRLPFRHGGRQSTLDTVLPAIKALPPACEPVAIIGEPHRWEKLLDDRGLDPTLWETIGSMNRVEGGIANEFVEQKPEEFVRRILELITEPGEPTKVASILGDVADQLAERPDVEADAAFSAEAVDHLGRLAILYDSAGSARSHLTAVRVEAARVRTSLRLAKEKAEADGTAAQERADLEDKSVAAERASASQWRAMANEYSRIAALYRRDQAQVTLQAETTSLGEAQANDRAWRVVPLLVERDDTARRLGTLEAEFAKLTEGAAPLERLRLSTAAHLAGALGSLEAAARKEVDAQTESVLEAERDLTSAHTAKDDATLKRIRYEERKRGLDALHTDIDASIDRARREGLIRADELAEIAFVRSQREDASDVARDGELGAERSKARSRVDAERERLTTELEPFANASRAAAERDRVALDRILALRQGLAEEPRILILSGTEAPDVIGMGPIIEEALGASILRSDQDLIALAIASVEDERARRGLATAQLLPPSIDVERALRVLEDARIPAMTGWRALAEQAEPSRRLTAFLSAPLVVGGVLVRNSDDLAKARELLADAGLAPTSIVGVATLDDLMAVFGNGHAPEAFVLPPDAALYDADRAAADWTERETRAEERELQRANLAAGQESDGELRRRLRSLLAECQPGDIERLTNGLELAEADARQAAEALTAAKERIRNDDLRDRAIGEELTQIAARRHARGRAMERLAALVDRVASAVATRAEADAIPGRIQTLDEEIRNRDREIVGSERRRDNAKGIAALRADEAKAFAAERASLPGGADATDSESSSLDVLRQAWIDANDAWNREVEESETKRNLATARRAASESAAKVARQDPMTVDRASRLLQTPDGSSEAARDLASVRAGEQVSELSQSVGRAQAELEQAETELTQATDRERVRLPEEPASRVEALRLEQDAIEQNNVHLELRRTAESRAAGARADLEAAEKRTSAFGSQVDRLSDALGPDEPDAQATPFAGEPDEAKAAVVSVRGSLAEALKADVAAQDSLVAQARDIALWTTDPRFVRVAKEVVSRFRERVVEELAPEARAFAAEMETRRAAILEHLKGLDQARDTVVEDGVGMVRRSLRDLRRLSEFSRLPAGLGGLEGEQFIDIGVRSSIDTSEAVLRARIGDEVDRISRERTRPGGFELLWRATKAAVGDDAFRVTILKPRVDLVAEPLPAVRLGKWSGGERVTASLMLFATIAKLRARNRGRAVGAGVVVLDNPLGSASHVTFLDLQRAVARAAGMQLVFLSGVSDMKAIGRFPCRIRLRNAPDRRLGRDFVHVTDRELGDDLPPAVVESTRIIQVVDTPAFDLA